MLSALRRAGAPYRLSPGALLTQTLVTSGTMTNRIDRLAEHGLVERLPSPDDRRGVLVQLTAAGLQRVDGAFADLLDVERGLLGGLPDDGPRPAGRAAARAGHAVRRARARSTPRLTRRGRAGRQTALGGQSGGSSQ